MASSAKSLSIIIPVYNGDEVIFATLDSLKPYIPLLKEIIIVDDFSNDNSRTSVKTWAKDNPHVEVKLVEQPQRLHTLQARIAGIQKASGEDIMFVDADDSLLPDCNLEMILDEKNKNHYEIIHFRSQFVGELRGEAFWNAPLANAPLFGEEIFSTYAALDFPPVLVWGKIYSTSLLQRIVPYLEKIKIFRLEDIFLVSMAMLYASSYGAVNEFAYLYQASNKWPLEKFAGRTRDLLLMLDFFSFHLEELSTPLRDKSNFMSFLRKRLNFNLTNMFQTLTDELQQGKSITATLPRVTQYLSLHSLQLEAIKNLVINIKRNNSLEDCFRYEGSLL